MRYERSWGQLGMKFNIWVDCPKVALTELLSFIVDNRGKTVPTSTRGWKLIATNCVTNNTLYPVYNKVRYLSLETYVNKGTPGRVCMVPDPVDFCIAQDMIALRVDEEKIYNKYLFAVLRSRKIQKQIYNMNVGDVIPHFKKQFLNQLQIPVPSKEIQKLIGDLYFQFSYKMELNNKINKNLEQQAQMLFDNFYDSLSGQSCILLSEMIDIRDGTHDSPKATEHGYPLVTSKHLLPFGVDTLSANIISKADYDKVNERSKVNTGDILISMIGTVGLISYVIDSPVEFAIKNVGLFKTSQHPSLDLYILYYLKSKSTTQHIEKCLAGSTQKYISLGELRKLPIVVPSPDELAAYNLVVRPIVSEIALLVQENRRLSNLRDTLLPKLMSGELDVSDLDL